MSALIDIGYNAVGVIKSQLCAAIVQSERVRNALNFSGVNCDTYDPDDPLTLIHTCIMPYLQHPDTITTTDPLIFVGVRTSENIRNPYLLTASVTFIISVDKDNMRTQEGYFREDLLRNGYICYTKPDYIADEIIKCISAISGTWIGDISNIESTESAMSNTRYCRQLTFRLNEINIGLLMQN